jgi:vacuolar-type H+-ATPase subunit E/Vma4
MNESLQERMEKSSQALLTHIVAVRDMKISGIIGNADQESRRILGAARRQARAQVKAVIAEIRRHREYDRQVAMGQAEHAVRSLQHKLMLSAIDSAMSLLKDTLAQLWTDSDAQLRWLNMTLAAADSRLNDGLWRLEHPQHWDARAATDMIRQFGMQRKNVHLELHASAEISAGFRIQCGGVLLDSALSGLFDNVGDIKGRLLGILENTPGWPAITPDWKQLNHNDS